MSAEERDSEKITRNWNELLQELRVTQTGSQVLAGFLLTVPFSYRFDQLSTQQVNVYLAVLCGSVLSTGLVVAPVAFHRLLFRQHQRPWIVDAANTAARVGLAALAATSVGVVYLVFDVTVGTTPALVSLGLSIVFFVALWVVLPLTIRRD